jgi:hypothetical protein
MSVKLENILKFDGKIDDVSYGMVITSAAKEVIPIEVDFENIFYDFLEIKTFDSILINSDIIMSLKLFDNTYSIIGRVIDSLKKGKFWTSTVKIEIVPEELFDEIVTMIKGSNGEDEKIKKTSRFQF